MKRRVPFDLYFRAWHCLSMNRAVLYAILLPALVTMVLTVAFVLFVDSHEVVPHDFNATTWREFF